MFFFWSGGGCRVQGSSFVPGVLVFLFMVLVFIYSLLLWFFFLVFSVASIETSAVLSRLSASALGLSARIRRNST